MYMTDEELVVQAIAGDIQAFRPLIERYELPLFRYAVYLVHDADAADDIVQDTFIKAYRNLNSFRTSAKFSSWIYRIAHNTAMDTLKHTHNYVADSEIISEQVSDAPSAAVLVDMGIAGQDIEHCLAQLPVKYREAVALHYLQDMSYREISDVTHVSVSAVGVRVSRAKRMLQIICKARGVHS